MEPQIQYIHDILEKPKNVTKYYEGRHCLSPVTLNFPRSIIDFQIMRQTNLPDHRLVFMLNASNKS